MISSIEVTRPKKEDIELLSSTLPKGTEVFVTMLPNRNLYEFKSSIVDLHLNDLIPIPHISARNMSSIEEINDLLCYLNQATNLDNVLLIGGDTDKATGSVDNVMSIITSGVLGKNNIHKVGVGGFPEGHPALDDKQLLDILKNKIRMLERINIEPYIVTQFCFDSKVIIDWVNYVRSAGINCKIKVGIPGPMSIIGLMSLAVKCGVKTSAKNFNKNLLTKAMGSYNPDSLIKELECLNIELHLFAFGGVNKAMEIFKS